MRLRRECVYVRVHVCVCVCMCVYVYVCVCVCVCFSEAVRLSAIRSSIFCGLITFCVKNTLVSPSSTPAALCYALCHLQYYMKGWPNHEFTVYSSKFN